MSGDFKSLADLHNEVLYNTLCGGINNPEDVKHLKDLFKDATTLHYDLFTDSIFYKKIEGPDSNSVIEYILPTIRRAYSKFFINTPSIFSSANSYGSQIKNYRLELYQLQFNLRDFLEFLSDKFLKNNDKLNDFKNLDTNSEILTLIVEDYIGSKVSYVSSVSSDELQKEIRDIKLSRHLSI
jgi:hypothetical protein